MPQKDEALSKAIQSAKGSKKLADALHIKPQALSQWKRVPALRVLAVEEITGVSRHELRPDIYPAPETAA